MSDMEWRTADEWKFAHNGNCWIVARVDGGWFEALSDRGRCDMRKCSDAEALLVERNWDTLDPLPEERTMTFMGVTYRSDAPGVWWPTGTRAHSNGDLLEYIWRIEGALGG